jgi:hypothetical protein
VGQRPELIDDLQGATASEVDRSEVGEELVVLIGRFLQPAEDLPNTGPLDDDADLIDRRHLVSKDHITESIPQRGDRRMIGDRIR